jgi:hypothetical protein
MPSALAGFLFGSVFPRVEDPLPKSIGLGFPFALAGAGGVFAGVIYADASPMTRNRAIGAGRSDFGSAWRSTSSRWRFR